MTGTIFSIAFNAASGQRATRYIRNLLVAMCTTLGVALAANAATSYPTPDSSNSAVRSGSLFVRPAANGGWTARLSATVHYGPWAVQYAQQVDDDSLDILATFSNVGVGGAQIYSAEVAVPVQPSTLKRVRFLSRSHPSQPIVLHAEVQLDQLCLTFDPSIVAQAKEFEPLTIPIRTVGAAGTGRPVTVNVSPTYVIDLFVDTQLPDDVCPTANSQSQQLVTLRVAGKPRGNYTVQLRHTTGKLVGAIDVRVAQKIDPVVATNLEFRTRGSYFLTGSATDVATLVALRGPSGERIWTVADDFLVWPASGDAPGTVVGVCRFFNGQLSTHFYSARSDDCSNLRATPGWTDEGIAFRTLLPDGEACPIGSSPVYRLFSATLANHRYTRNIDTYHALRAAGWTAEGVAFCSPKL